MSGGVVDLRTPACDLLGCEVPIVLAGMGGVARSELVVAISEAGGFGFLGMVREAPEFILREVAAVRGRTARNFGVTLIPAATTPDLLRHEVAACIEAKVHCVSLFWDLDPELIQVLHDAGILVAWQVGSAEEARGAVAAGADLLIAQGVEAGGHVRGRTPLASLVPAVAAAVKVPVLAAGGLVEGGDVARVMGWGAQGAVIGTGFLATEESFAHELHKQRVVAAGPNETLLTTVFHRNWPWGAAVRVLPNSVTRGERGDPFAPDRQVIGYDDARPIHLFSTDSPLRSTAGDLEAMAIYAGAGAARVQAIGPAAQRLHAIVQAARMALERPAAEPEPSSPVCYAAEADDVYMGYAGRDELTAELNVLLEAERAGALVAAQLALDAPDEQLDGLATTIQADEVRWCRMLLDALAELDAAPSAMVGDFHRKASAIGDPIERIAFLNRGQSWVVRRVQTLLPRIRDDRLHAKLKDMLVAHEQNIDTVRLALESRAR